MKLTAEMEYVGIEQSDVCIIGTLDEKHIVLCYNLDLVYVNLNGFDPNFIIAVRDEIIYRKGGKNERKS